MSKRQSQSNKLFLATNELSDVVLNWHGQSIEKLNLYAEAYHSAARSLLENSSDDQLRDINACPVVFLYRLALELYLKAILIVGSKILRRDGLPFKTAKEILNKRHNLLALLEEFGALCRQLGWNSDEEYESFGEIIREFVKKDPGSFCFRYQVAMSGESSLEEDFRFDLHNFCARMDEALAFLEQIDDGLLGILDQVETI